MKILLTTIFSFSAIGFLILTCSEVQRTSTAKKKADNMAVQSSSLTSEVQNETSKKFESFTDPRDGETYATIKIGKQVWMAENLRYNAPGSVFNPDYPSPNYGRLYDGISVQTACPDGWHLPSDAEWNELEMELGMSAADMDISDWRGTHGHQMKSVTGWEFGQNGINSSGFNAYPAGFYGFENFDGLGSSVGYWSTIETGFYEISAKNSGGKAWVRFLGAPLKGVNRMYDEQLTWSLACRCVKD